MARDLRVVTCSAPVNIAVIKYWGKRDEVLILPVNSSLSVTLNQTQLRAITSVATSKSFTRDRMWLNGQEEDINHPRLQNALREIRKLARQEEGDHFHICSENNFPTAAGLASSAAGYACLVYSLSRLLQVDSELSAIARQGSGSACRSMYGGFVKWEKGDRPDGRDSIAVQVATETHWPEMHALILVVNAGKKIVSSTVGMETTVHTSQLLKYRSEHVVPHRMVQMEKAIKERNFEEFAKITMQDSNQFHAVCLDTDPPIFYLNDISKRIIQLITIYNSFDGNIKAAYTFDAGPNAVLYTLSSQVSQLLALVSHFFPPDHTSESPFVIGLSQTTPVIDKKLAEQFQMEPIPGSLKYIIHTKVGGGPCQLNDPKQCLLNGDGLPNRELHHTSPM